MNCYKCQSTHSIKNGHRGGKQCWLCKTCGRQFTGDYSFIEREKRAAITLCCLGLSMRKIGWLLGYSHVTILNWVRDFEERTTTDESLMEEGYLMELDEVCDFLATREANPRFGKRFATPQAALTWSLENEITKILQKSLRNL